MNYRLEVVVVPVSDVERAKAFYTEQLGFNVDHDTQIGDDMRIAQLTPQGSGCSIVIGTAPPLPDMQPGSLSGLQLVVTDMEPARAELVERGLEITEVEELGAPGKAAFKFAYFHDPDGNGWALQEIPG